MKYLRKIYRALRDLFWLCVLIGLGFRPFGGSRSARS
jgi:hypothetical protein